MLSGKFANYTQVNKRYLQQMKELTEENQKLKLQNTQLEKALSAKLNILLEEMK